MKHLLEELDSVPHNLSERSKRQLLSVSSVLPPVYAETGDPREYVSLQIGVSSCRYLMTCCSLMIPIEKGLYMLWQDENKVKLGEAKGWDLFKDLWDTASPTSANGKEVIAWAKVG